MIVYMPLVQVIRSSTFCHELTPKANGNFGHEDPDECKKFYLCDKGVAHKMPRVLSLVFVFLIGSCMPEDKLSHVGKIGLSVSGDT